MAHNTLVRNPVTNWTLGSQVILSEVIQLDQNLAHAINGDDGGAWAPTSPIVIGGSGLVVTGPSLVGTPGEIGGYLSVEHAAGVNLNSDAADFPQLGATHPGRTRSIAYDCLSGAPLQRPGWFPRWTDAGMQSLAPMIDLGDGQGPQAARLLVPLRAHIGASLDSVTVHFRVGWPHTTLPPVMPGARVIQIAPDGTFQVLNSGGDASGFVYATKPSTPDLWSGQQSIALTCSGSISAGANYYVDIIDEHGLTGYPWVLTVKKSVVVVANQNVNQFAGPGDAPWGLVVGGGGIDGYNVSGGSSTFNDGDRVLLNAQNQPMDNGIWVAHSGPWTRATDLQVSSDFTPGLIVPVDYGSGFKGTYWQMSGAQPQVWQSGHGYTSGDLARPTSNLGVYFQCTVSGTSGATEPSWPSTPGSTVADNGIVWTFVGPLPSAVLLAWSPGTMLFGTSSWQSGHAYSTGNVTRPTALHVNGFWYVASTGGTSAGVGNEPAWPTAIGASVADGTAVWTCQGPTPTPSAFVPRGTEDNETPRVAGTMMLPHGNIFQMAVASFSGIGSQSFQ